MMIVVAWLVYCFLVAAVLTAGAMLWERAARWSGRPARWGWLLALGGSVTLPWLLRLVPERTWTEAVPAPLQVLSLDALTVTTTTAGRGIDVQQAAFIAWIVLSALVLAYVGVMLVRLTHARRSWRSADVDGTSVLVTGDVGPAAIGSSVVVPAWVLELDAGMRALLLRHERSHIEAGDPRMLMTALALLAAMPWNPVVWLQVLRLRNAIELDCDARVLGGGADPQRYGRLLLEVGRRRSAHALVMATFAEPRLFLEERIRRIAQWPLSRSRSRAVVFAATSLLLFAGALSCDPVRVSNPDPVVTPTAEADAAMDRSAAPRFTPMTVRPELANREEVQRALVEAYPRELRESGIGGSPTVWFFVDSTGAVLRTMLAQSSGYREIDEAAIAVAKAMKFSPALNREQKVSVWVQIPIVFSAHGVETAARPKPVRTPVPPRPQPQAGELPELVPLSQLNVNAQREGDPRPTLANRRDVQRALIEAYPPLLRDAGIGGSPIVMFKIDDTGAVRDTRISKSSGYPALDAAALQVAKVMKFDPAMKDGKAVAVEVEIPIVFTAK